MQCGAPVLRREEGVGADMLREAGSTACCPPTPPQEECLAASSSLGTAPGTEALPSCRLLLCALLHLTWQPMHTESSLTWKPRQCPEKR